MVVSHKVQYLGAGFNLASTTNNTTHDIHIDILDALSSDKGHVLLSTVGQSVTWTL